MTQKANMHRGKGKTHGPNKRANLTRREFIKGIGIGGGALVLLGRFGIHATAWAGSGNPVLKMVLVDYGKCTGCRTCEAVCSSHNRPVTIRRRATAWTRESPLFKHSGRKL